MLTLTHLLKISPWPFFIGGGGAAVVSSFVIWFKFGGSLNLILALSFASALSYFWWVDVTRESSGGEYSPLTVDGLKLGMLLFIFSEVCFFAAFFWGFFHSSFTPVLELGGTWPPVAIASFNPFHVPLLNTTILLSSGATVTWAHHLILGGVGGVVPLFVTCALGVYFTMLQGFEYYVSSFTMADSVFGRVFFIATGFHGVHVLVGTSFLVVCLFRHMKRNFSAWGHTGLESAIWYWHFVDVVWLFLFCFIYWWGRSE